jgi:hypothetical protein
MLMPLVCRAKASTTAGLPNPSVLELLCMIAVYASVGF